MNNISGISPQRKPAFGVKVNILPREAAPTCRAVFGNPFAENSRIISGGQNAYQDRLFNNTLVGLVSPDKITLANVTRFSEGTKKVVEAACKELQKAGQNLTAFIVGADRDSNLSMETAGESIKYLRKQGIKPTVLIGQPLHKPDIDIATKESITVANDKAGTTVLCRPNGDLDVFTGFDVQEPKDLNGPFKQVLFNGDDRLYIGGLYKGIPKAFLHE